MNTFETTLSSFSNSIGINVSLQPGESWFVLEIQEGEQLSFEQYDNHVRVSFSVFKESFSEESLWKLLAKLDPRSHSIYAKQLALSPEGLLILRIRIPLENFLPDQVEIVVDDLFKFKDFLDSLI